MSRITITLPNELIDELLEVLPSKSKTEAVVRAIKDKIRQKKKDDILAMAGNFEFIDKAGTLRHQDSRLG